MLLLLVLVVAAVGSSRQRVAWMEGYLTGQAAADGVTVPMPYGSSFSGQHGGLIMPALLILGLMLGSGVPGRTAAGVRRRPALDAHLGPRPRSQDAGRALSASLGKGSRRQAALALW